MSTDARVFIGIPTVNRPDWVQETVRSVLAQTFTSFRVVVSDNASEPGAAAAVRSFVEGLGDPRVSFHQQAENVFEYGQGRFFFAEAREDYFVILHDDDLLNPDYLAQAVAALDQRPALDLFVANPYVFDEAGQRWPDRTRAYLREHGRTGRPEGEFDVLGTLLRWGLAPISGTVFRRAALESSGFVDADCGGNYPFEVNVLLRLGERGARGWFSPRELLGFRFHRNALRVYLRLSDNPRVVGTMITLFERRRFSGWREARRRQILGRLHREAAFLRLRQDDVPGCRHHLWTAARTNPFALRLWGALPLAVVAPRLLRAALPPLPATREAPPPPSNPQLQPRINA
jgi:glycosyltransferase involved in cell wall biosynthesis